MRKSISKISAIGDKSLLDTGPLVALLSRNDSAHERCVSTFESFHGHLLTTEAVLTEAMHLLGRHTQGPIACLDFFFRAGVLLVPLDAKRITHCRELIARYANVPMDFADATLVALADEFGIGAIFTLDHRGFSTYRWRKSRRFTISP